MVTLEKCEDVSRMFSSKRNSVLVAVYRNIRVCQNVLTVLRSSVAATMPNTTVQPERKPAFARPSGTTTSATAPAAKRNTITDSSTASDRCKCSSLESPRVLYVKT